MFKGQVTSEAKLSELEIKRQITSILLDKAACTTTFSGVNLGAEVSQIKNGVGVIIFDKIKTYENNSLKIKKIKTVDKNIANPDGTRIIDLVVGLERVKKQAYGQFEEVQIPLTVKSTGPGSPILECFSNSDAIKLEASGVLIGGDCSTKGTLAFDIAADQPVYCDQNKKWKVSGGGGLGNVTVTLYTTGANLGAHKF